MIAQHVKAISMLEALNEELDSIIKNAFYEERKHLTNLEINHLTKMTDYTVMKIKQQIKIETYEYL
jgi:DNA polymerase III delta prime subunit